MSSRNWSDDDELMRELAEALRPEPGEQQVRAAARGAYEWRTADIDVELAALLYDSDLDQTVRVRGPLSGSPRILVFGTADLRVEMEFSESGIEGQLIPPEPGAVRLLTSAGATEETTTDELGCFSFPPRRRGPIRVACLLSCGQFVTEWVTG
ncbi:MAG TPA: hypothetical protein VFZ32_06645 [Micromonosporaceae bacterium]